MNNKVIAFYLPQFHAIPENDMWWGKGFTEWTNTKKATPLFEGHYQPKVPLNENYYDLTDITVMERQAELAKKNGVSGFCYYHYWMGGGKKLLEKPIEAMLKNKKVDILFCLCWANENWTRNWDGGNREVIVAQEYGKKKDWETHFLYLLNYFRDSRYIKIDGSPIFVIYKPEQIIFLEEMLSYWRKRAKEEGFKDIIFLRQYPGALDNCMDYAIKFQPATLWCGWKKNIEVRKSIGQRMKLNIKKAIILLGMESYLQKRMMKKTSKSGNKINNLTIYNYDELWESIINEQEYSEKLCNGGFVMWDNTARNKSGMVFNGATPEKFEKYMIELLQKPSALDLVFINAWNEWGEGAYLEPDQRYGYSYLQALSNAVNYVKNELST